MIKKHFDSVSQNKFSITAFEKFVVEKQGTDEERLNAKKWISAASKTKSTPWFKNVSAMEYIGSEIIAPNLANLSESAPIFYQTITEFFSWAENNA